jgi:hypothetical protein
MTQFEMMQRIGAGVRLRTLSRGIEFDLRADKYGLLFRPRTSGKLRDTPWAGKQWNWRTSVPELFEAWIAAGRPTEAVWLERLAVERGNLSGYWNASYLLAAFLFLAS